MRHRVKQIGCVVLFLLSWLALSAQSDIAGLSCENPLVLTDSFSTYIPGGGSYWFTAWTYDLPLHTRYIMEGNHLEEEPVAYVDFTCTSGVYEDPNLATLINDATGWGVPVPMKFVFEREYRDGKTYFDVEVSASYREMMMNYGITYNVQAYVNVQIPRSGWVELVPDTVFRTCVENSRWLSLPDEVEVSVQTLDSTYVLPMSDWVNDSIRFRWLGTTTPVRVWVGEQCDFELKTTGENCALDYFDLFPNAGNNEHIRDYSQKDINDFIKMFGVGGVYYLRVSSSETAPFIIEPKPIEGPLASAIELKLGKDYEVGTQDVEQCYFFRKTWRKQSIRFRSSVSDTVFAYFGSTPDFAISDKDEHYLSCLPFLPDCDGTWELLLSSKELANLAAKGDMEFTFVRFKVTSSTIISPSIWETDECEANSYQLLLNAKQVLQPRRTTNAYRICYDQWQRGDVKLYWDGITDLYIYLLDTCAGALGQYKPYTLYYKKQPYGDTLTIDTAMWHSWRNRVDEGGWLYFRFNNTNVGELHIYQTPVDSHNPPTPLPSVEYISVSIICTDEGIFVYVCEEQDLTLYDAQGQRMDSWHQQVGTSHFISCPRGTTYMLQGKAETIKIVR